MIFSELEVHGHDKKTAVYTQTIVSVLLLTLNKLNQKLHTMVNALDGDGIPVNIVFLLVGPPESKSRHIRLLSRISRILTRESFTRALAGADTPERVLELLRDEELNLSGVS